MARLSSGHSSIAAALIPGKYRLVLALCREGIMTPMRWIAHTAAALALTLAACAGLPRLEAPRVSLADIDAVSFEGMELRMRVKLRVQNPNGIALDYDGIDVNLALQGKAVA